MTLNEIVSLLAEKGISVSVLEDNDGQIVIYTGQKLGENETLIPFDEWEAR